jgi:hypothetical protein
MKMGARLASIAAACIALLLGTAWVATGASAWTGLHDAGMVSVSGAIGEITPEPLPPVVGTADYDCGDGAFEVAVRNPNGADLAVTVELWLTADDGPRTPMTKLGESARTLPAGATARLHVGADDPAAGSYRLKVDAAGADALWSGVVAVEAACETGDPPPAEPTAEPAVTETPAATETETPAPTDESTAEPGAGSTAEPTAESTQDPAPEETVTPADGG